MLQAARHMLAALVLLGCAAVGGAQTTWFVDDDAPAGPGPPGSAADPFCTVQEGIDAASDGDLVLVLPGTYVERIDFLGKAVVVRGAAGPAATILQAPSSFSFVSTVSFASGEGRGAVLEGLTITGASGPPAVHCDGASPTIRGNVIRQNIGFTAGGGGIRCENAANAHILDNDIVDNGSWPAEGQGAGIWAMGCTLTIRGNRILRNNAFGDPIGEGAGIWLFACVATIEDNLIAGNTARDYGGNFGGGLLLYGCMATLDGNTIADNRADSGSFAQGSGGGLFVNGPSLVWISNTIFWNNRASLGRAIHVAGGTVGVIWSDVELGLDGTFTGSGSLAWGDGNRSVAPLFVDQAGGDYHLLPGSPLVDAGRPAEPAGGTDGDRDPRLLDGDGDGLARRDVGYDEHDRTRLDATGSATLGGMLTFTTLGPAANYCYALCTADGVGDRDFGPYGSLLLDLASLSVVALAVAPDSNDVLLPADPSLAGHELHAQSLAIALTGTPGSFSNRLSFVLH